MPVSAGSSRDEPVRPQHPIEGRALLVYRGEKVYVAPEEPAVVDRVARLPDVRRLARDEAVEFEATLPGQGAFPAKTSGHIGLGDAIAWLTGRLHIQECSACRRRKNWLNSVIAWRSGTGG